MKNNLSILAAAWLLGGASSVFAASSTDLTVTGTITPRACTPSLSGGGNADHGKISAKDLLPDKYTYLPVVTLQMTVNCDAATPYALSPTDNQSGTGTAGNYFGLGLINGGEKLGYFRVIPRNVRADNVEVQPIASFDDGLTWLPVGSRHFWGSNNIWGVGAIRDSSTPILVKDLTMDLDVRTGIAPANGLNLTNEVQINGSATLELKYL